MYLGKFWRRRRYAREKVIVFFGISCFSTMNVNGRGWRRRMRRDRVVELGFDWIPWLVQEDWDYVYDIMCGSPLRWLHGDNELNLLTLGHGELQGNWVLKLAHVYNNHDRNFYFLVQIQRIVQKHDRGCFITKYESFS